MFSYNLITTTLNWRRSDYLFQPLLSSCIKNNVKIFSKLNKITKGISFNIVTLIYSDQQRQPLDEGCHFKIYNPLKSSVLDLSRSSNQWEHLQHLESSDESQGPDKEWFDLENTIGLPSASRSGPMGGLWQCSQTPRGTKIPSSRTGDITSQSHYRQWALLLSTTGLEIGSNPKHPLTVAASLEFFYYNANGGSHKDNERRRWAHLGFCKKQLLCTQDQISVSNGIP